MDTKDFRGVALNPYYEFSVEVPLSNYGVRFEDYQKAFQAGFRRAHRYWDGIEDVTVVSETPTLLVRRLHFGGGASATDCIEGSGERFTHWILDTEGKVHGTKRNHARAKRGGRPRDARLFARSLGETSRRKDRSDSGEGLSRQGRGLCARRSRRPP